ncbi:flagellar hook-basal body complex protein FliE [Clostridium cavendishii DSM 21758]|uniref:Flagellar hook-basal body complex protein FliE n=1 Tax=Clostridium cavendishii DSM 21758 TaxID=1121302 RepID=A0A1M6AVR1_9CLOT|nr:flagellar hook-basal body complex protein FliE [Clostridium cavendishii]SHI40565.1 flagellar hook-basal body complex protein FliE [Clostridium cavendishii DSM 21758]
MKINNFIPDISVFEKGIEKTSNQPKDTNNGLSFIDTLKTELDKVNDKQIDANVLTDKMVKGDKDVDIHQVMIAGEEAKMSLQLAAQVRNKLVEAYQELSRMQL